MAHSHESHDEDLIDLGAVSTETRGGPNQPRIDLIGNFGGGGLSDDQ